MFEQKSINEKVSVVVTLQEIKATLEEIKWKKKTKGRVEADLHRRWRDNWGRLCNSNFWRLAH